MVDRLASRARAADALLTVRDGLSATDRPSSASAKGAANRTPGFVTFCNHDSGPIQVSKLSVADVSMIAVLSAQGRSIGEPSLWPWHVQPCAIRHVRPYADSRGRSASRRRVWLALRGRVGLPGLLIDGHRGGAPTSRRNAIMQGGVWTCRRERLDPPPDLEPVTSAADRPLLALGDVRNPQDAATYGEALAKMVVDDLPPLTAPIEIRDYDSAWPQLYIREMDRVRRVLGGRVVRLEHVGSTSVPGLPAKPIVDMVLEVPDSADEPAYVPALDAAGYVLRIREPDWFEHRLFKGPDTDVNLHTFSAGCSETDRMVLFRDWLRANAADCDKYAATKRELARRDWKFVQQYADAKSEVVAEIMARATAAWR